MTNFQRKTYNAIKKHKYLGIILEKTRISDYQELQNALMPNSLYFHDQNCDNNTLITITNNVLSELENKNRIYKDRLFTRIMAIWGGVTGTIAITLELMKWFL